MRAGARERGAATCSNDDGVSFACLAQAKLCGSLGCLVLVGRSWRVSWIFVLFVYEKKIIRNGSSHKF